MPTKRVKIAPRQIGIPRRGDHGLAAGDFHGLARALDLKPWLHPSLCRRTLTALGVDDGPPRPILGTRGRLGKSLRVGGRCTRARLGAPGRQRE